jgi:aspartyl-tRNA(Asn)/glutamyl-tRNA(Gln) amidotransferase subunit A
MTELTSLTLAQARDRPVQQGDHRCGADRRAYRRGRGARALNAFVLETPDQARAMARASDAKLRKGEGGPLEGIPLGIKDLFCTKGVRTTACSKILDGFTPTYESTITANLWRRRRRDARQAQQ